MLSCQHEIMRDKPDKPNKLQAAMGALNQRRVSDVVPSLDAVPGRIGYLSNKRVTAPSREGKKAVMGYFDESVSKKLRRLSLDTDRSMQDLLAEALNDLFEKHERPPIVTRD